MTTRAKGLAIVAILWVAAVGVITVVFAVNRPTHVVRFGTYGSDGRYTGTVLSHPFDWGWWLAATGIATLVALAAMAIVALSPGKVD